MKHLLLFFSISLLLACGSGETSLEYPANFLFDKSDVGELKVYDYDGSALSETAPNSTDEPWIGLIGSEESIANSFLSDLYPAFTAIELLSDTELKLFSKTDPTLEVQNITYKREGSKIYFEAAQDELCALELELNEASGQLRYSYILACFWEEDIIPIIESYSCSNSDLLTSAEQFLELTSAVTDHFIIVEYEDVFLLSE